MTIHGKDILILNATGTALIGATKSCEIDVEVDTEEVSSPLTGTWKTYRIKRKGWSTTISHLVTTLKGTLLTVDNTVTLKATVSDNSGLPFDGFVNNPTVQQSGLTREPAYVYWDTTRLKFLAYYESNYYDSWSQDPGYQSPTDYMHYHYNNTSYVWHNNALSKDILTGTAIVRQGRITGSVGSIAQGRVRLLGTGPLEEPTT